MEPWLLARARQTPEAPALLAGAKRRSFGELTATVDVVARRLATIGVRAGARLALVAEPSETVVEVVHATQRLGAVLVPLDPRLTRGELGALLERTRPALVLSDRPDAMPAPAWSLEALGGVFPAPVHVLRDVIEPESPHTIIFTSGTSGRPKGVVLTHAAHQASALAQARRLATSADDRWLCCLPLHHVGGLSILLRSVLSGFAVLLHPRFDVAAVEQALAEGGVTTISLVARMLARLLDATRDHPSAPKLRCMLVGGGPLPTALAARARGAGLPLARTYGLSEAASQVCTSVAGEAAAEPGYCGPPLEGVEVRIAAPAADGVGEILVRGPILMRGYLDDLPATTAAVRNGWLHTGDLGRLTPDGGLIVDGRRTDLVVTGGENVSPAEVEAVLGTHPAVADVAVVGLPDDAWGQRVVAAVVIREPCEPDALRAFCRGRVAPHKVPREVRVLAELPRTAAGKVARAALVDLLSAPAR
jgi:O-succinylbenzoic acid--CoA ligase